MQTDVLLTGTMGNIQDVVRHSLESHGLSVEHVNVDQNVFRDEFGYHRFTGGLETSIAAGFDIPYLLWKLNIQKRNEQD